MPVSLSKALQLAIRKWFVWSFVVSITLAGFISYFLMKSNYEDMILSQAKAASMSFRTQILEGSTRFTEDQIKSLFSLSDDESAYLLNSDGAKIYNSNDTTHIQTCAGKLACWDYKNLSVHTSSPIYFDSEQKNLFGYLYLSRKIKFDSSLFLAIGTSIFFGLALLIFGLRSTAVKLSDGLLSTISLWSNQLKANPKSFSVVYDKNPITELEPMAKALAGLNQQIADLESKAEYAAKLRLVRSVAHDLLTPISQIDKYLFLLKTQAANGELSLPMLADLEKSVLRLKNLAQQTKDLRQLESFDAKSEIDLVSEVSESVRNLKAAYHEDINIQVTVDNHIDGSFKTLANSLQIDRIVTNLIKNAVQSSKASSEIKVSISSTDGKAILTVEDQGIGISPTNIEKIFSPDFTTKPATGTGLGLSIVKEICDSIGAKVYVRSIVGVGSKFTVEFSPQKGVFYETQATTH